MEINLKSPITEIKGFGPKKAEAFARLGIFCIGDLLRYFPRDYEDLRNKKLIADLVNEEKAVVEATVVYSSLGRGYGRRRNLHLSIMDKTGKMDIIFFMAGFMSKNFKIGEKYRFYGKVKLDGGRAVMFHPAYAPLDDDEEGGIQPLYPLTKGLSQKDIKKAVRFALAAGGIENESLPASIIEKAKLCPIDFALNNVHFPGGRDQYQVARYRLIFEELFDLRVALKLSANRFGSGREGISFSDGSFADFIDSLKYNLTNAQTKVLAEIEFDMNSKKAMSRLVQGDVGSGKTIVAEAALFKAVKAGYQGAYMAPTEILAMQHFESFKKDFEAFGIEVECITSALKAGERKAILEKLKSGECKILIGTHALISKDVEFKNLGLAITDEQHRFGVNQRKLLSEKGKNPDILVMTATPIPRTLAVVLYSDLDISVIDELPPGRKEIKTLAYNSDTRKEAYRILLKEVQAGHQAYIVAPFIEDSESIEAFSAEAVYEDFSKNYPEISSALLHGGMRQSEKEEIMSAYARGEISVLISTVVIEVGINVANATVMLIENTERFGLAQLHQLRGRVGRGDAQSYCLLVTGEESEISKSRVDIMVRSSDGFEIAEKDLELRGPGELFGYRQHGLPQLQLADPIKHTKLIVQASALADELLGADPGLDRPENSAFKEKISESFGNFDKLVL